MRARIAKLIHNLADRIGGLDAQAERETKDRALQALGRLKRHADGRLAAVEEEAARRDKMELLNAKAPPQWQSQYYVRQGYRIVPNDNASQGHWRGGRPLHDDAICPHCRKPLLLMYDINCRDPRLRKECPELFGELDRLPLYYCCRRPDPTVYQLLDNGQIRVMRPDLQGWEQSPFSDFPDSFERKPVALVPIPRDIENLLVIAGSFDFDWLKSAERDRLSEYLGADAQWRWNVRLTQFGGRLLLNEANADRECPNKACLTHQMGHPLLRDPKHFQMKQLVLIDKDAGFEMQMNGAQIAFYICWKCHTVQTEYRCT